MTSRSELLFGVAEGAIQNNSVSGDRYLIKKSSNSVLLAVVDGLGHGNDAALAAKIATDMLNDLNSDSLIDLIGACHARLKKTRGVAISLALIQNDYDVSWLGIGNIAVVHWRKGAGIKSTTQELLSQGGILGSNIVAPRILKFVANPGDTMIFATDGIFNQFLSIQPMCHALPQTIADYIFETNRNPDDDALVLVTRWANSMK